MGWRHAASPNQTHLKLASGWPARSRRLLEETHALAAGWLESALQRSLECYAAALLQAAEGERDPRLQQQQWEARQLLLRHDGSFIQQFLEDIAHGYERLGAVPSAELIGDSSQWMVLTPMEQSLQGRLDQLVAQSSWRSATLLHELSYRFAALLGSAPLEGVSLPLGPAALLQAWRRAAHALPLPMPQLLGLLDHFEQQVADTLEPLYETINEHLQADGILPQLRRYVQSRPVASGPAPPARGQAPHAAPDRSVQQLLELRRRLRQRRRQPPPRDIREVRQASAQQLDAALRELSHRHGGDHRQRLRSAEHLHHAVLAQLNQGSLAQLARTGLDDHQYDTLELLGLLIGAIAGQLHPDSRAQPLLDQLQLPLLRLALADPGFFEPGAHPARKLLETVSQIAYDWLEGHDGLADQELAQTLGEMLATIADAPPSAETYAELQQRIDAHMALLTRRARINERRQIEAMQGRERLELARQQANAVLATRFERAQPRGLLRVLLERAWSDVLALTLLRHGEHSEEFIRHLRLTDQLLGRLPTADRLQLRHQVEHGLLQIGMPEQEAQQVAKRLLEQPDVAAIGRLQPANDHAYQQSLQNRQRLGQHQLDSGQAEPPPLGQLDELELQVLSHLQQVPFGTWFEFRDAANEQLSRCKLAWYSPRSGRSLLLNRRGQRSRELSLSQLASAVAQGQASQLVRSQQDVFERAWQDFTEELGATSEDARGASRLGFRA